jgi:glycerol-3-phosphate acyltransferase PlsY
VATGAGVFIPICWQAVVAAVVVFVLVVIFWRYVSLASISASASLPLLIYFLYAPGHAPPLIVSAGATLCIALVIWRHRSNIQRLLAGTEPCFSFRRGRNGERV